MHPLNLTLFLNVEYIPITSSHPRSRSKALKCGDGPQGGVGERPARHEVLNPEIRSGLADPEINARLADLGNVAYATSAGVREAVGERDREVVEGDGIGGAEAGITGTSAAPDPPSRRSHS